MSFESTCTVNCLYWTDDTQAYIRMDCTRGNSVSALGVGGNGLWTKTIVAYKKNVPFAQNENGFALCTKSTWPCPLKDKIFAP